MDSQSPSRQLWIIIKLSEATDRMKANLPCITLLGLRLLSLPTVAQSGPPAIPLAGDWDGVLTLNGVADHLAAVAHSSPQLA